MLLALFAVGSLSLVGHLVLSIHLSNRLHAVALPRKAIQMLTAVDRLLMVLVPVAVGAWLVEQRAAWDVPGFWFRPGALAVAAYLLFCGGVALVAIPSWYRREFLARPPAVLKSNHSVSCNLQRRLGERLELQGLGRVFAALPGNEILRLEINEKTLELPRLVPALDGLSIAHLSDLHFTGEIGKAFFQEIVGLTNQMQPDLVAVTGDICDRARCVDWVGDTLGGLRARHGVYYVLGNHDRRVDHRRLRRQLDEAGLIALAGRWIELSIAGQRLVLAGNELPWFKPAPNLPAEPSDALRILLSHSPDQIRWAQRQEFDLMLAGHTHGGQIRLPLLGPVISPSQYGVRYASGTFHEPPTVMHVSRGLSGLQPIRFNCPPELTKVILRAPVPPHAVPSSDQQAEGVERSVQYR